MKCDFCGKDIYTYENIGGKKSCSECVDKIKKCEVCGKIVDRRQMISDKFACDICYGNISKSRNDQRITLLNSTPTSPEIKTAKEIDEFDSLGHEALSTAIYLKNYDILGVNSNATLGGIRDKCKELLKIWHPELHKDDAEKYSLAVNKVAEFKNAYESIVAEVEKPYKALELKYGASQKEVMQSYENLKSVYDPNHFDDNIQLKEKVRCKRNEITKAFEDLMMLFQANPRTQNSAMRQQEKKISKPSQSQLPSAAVESRKKPSFTSENQTSARIEAPEVVAPKLVNNTVIFNSASHAPPLRMDKNKGKKWALNVLWMVVAFNGFKLLFSLSSANPSETAGMAIISMIGGVVILCPIAFTIGYFQKNTN